MKTRNPDKPLDFDPYTKVPNVVFGMSEISMQARFLYSVLLHHCGPLNTCFPGQEMLAKQCQCSTRYIHTLLRELERFGLISWKQHYCTSNTYTVKKTFLDGDKNNGSAQLRTMFHRQLSTTVLPSSNLEKKEANTVDSENSGKGMELLRETMAKLGMIKLDEVIKISDNGKEI